MAFRPTKTTGESLRSAGALSTVGLAFVLALVIGFWIGDRLDTWLKTAPLFTLVFFFAGLAAGILNVVRTVSRAFPSPRGSTPTAGGAAPRAPGEESGPSATDLRDGDE